MLSSHDISVARYLCNACNTEFGDWRQFVDHHVTQHPTIERGFSIIDPNLKQVWTRVTNPVGLLNVCSAHLAGLGKLDIPMSLFGLKNTC